MRLRLGELRHCPAYIREWVTRERGRSLRRENLGNRVVRNRSRELAAKETVMAKLADVVEATAIRPFHVSTPEAELTELRRRINATRWPDRETVTDASQGVQLAFMQALARYWATDYNWRRCEAQLNSHPQFITEIDGLDIHFIHVRSRHEDAMPLIVTHGWPGSPIEQLKIIDPLTNPRLTAPVRRTPSTW
jgi:Epoxide hydrolase N terminus